jgi:L-iditol 2-dehydrogenase
VHQFSRQVRNRLAPVFTSTGDQHYVRRRYHSNDDVRIGDLPIPEIGPAIAVQLQAVACASDVMEWYMKPRAPIYPGHEPVGIIAAVGEGVQQFSVGQRVFIHHHVPCMVCHFCQRGSFSQCPIFRATRLYPGGLAEYIRVPALNVLSMCFLAG